MKFECPSCGKKYSLPDEKVPAGKDFKVKCKKCGEIIVLRAPDPAEAALAPEPTAPVEEQAPPQAAPAAFAPQEAGGPFGQQAAGPFDPQAGGPFGQQAEGQAGAVDEQPTRVFDYSRMGMEGAADPAPGGSASAQAEAFQPMAPAEPVAAAPPPAAAPSLPDDIEWHIAVDGDQMGPYETAQMLEMMAASQITDETYIWRDGYDDWLPLSDVSELQGAGVPAAAAPAPVPAAASPGSPFAISSGGAGQDLFASAGSEGPAESSPFAAPGGQDVVSSSMDQAPQAPRLEATDLKGARHENSVLFSLSSLQALASSSRDPAPGTASAPGSATSEGGSGLIDIRSLTGGAPTATGAAPSDDILSMGGAGIGSSVGVPSLLQPAKKEPSKLPYILGGVFGLLAIGAIAVLLVIVLGKDKGAGVDEEAMRQKIMADLIDKGMTKEQAEKAADKEVEAKAGEAEGEGEAAAEGEEKEGEGEEASSTPGGKKKKKKKPGGSGSGGGETEPSVPKPSTAGSGKKPTAAEDDLMALLAGATKGKKTPKKETTPGKPPPTPTPKKEENLPAKPTKQQVMSALNGVKPKVQACGKGQTGVATVSINIAGSTGKVASAKVVSGPFKGTPNAACIEKAVKRAKFSKFSQAKFSVSYPFVIK